jgi:hypothetical protein
LDNVQTALMSPFVKYLVQVRSLLVLRMANALLMPNVVTAVPIVLKDQMRLDVQQNHQFQVQIAEMTNIIALTSIPVLDNAIPSQNVQTTKMKPTAVQYAIRINSNACLTDFVSAKIKSVMVAKIAEMVQMKIKMVVLCVVLVNFSVEMDFVSIRKQFVMDIMIVLTLQMKEIVVYARSLNTNVNLAFASHSSKDVMDTDIVLMERMNWIVQTRNVIITNLHANLVNPNAFQIEANVIQFVIAKTDQMNSTANQVVETLSFHAQTGRNASIHNENATEMSTAMMEVTNPDAQHLVGLANSCVSMVESVFLRGSNVMAAYIAQI